jgi:hypothetical protein
MGYLPPFAPNALMWEDVCAEPALPGTYGLLPAWLD